MFEAATNFVSVKSDDDKSSDGEEVSTFVFSQENIRDFIEI